MRFPLLRLTAPIAATAIAGCNSSSSSDGSAGGTPIRTRDMYISATVEAADDVTAVAFAILTPRSGTRVTGPRQRHRTMVARRRR